MMKTVDTLMVLLFPFLDFLPYTLPRYWMFRDRLRIPFKYIVLLQILLSSAYSAAFYYINLGGYEAAARWTTFLRYGFMLVFMTLAFVLIRESFSKLIFTYLLLLAWSFFVFGNANFIESRFFGDFSDLHPYLIYNTARVVIYLITCPFLFRFFYHTVTDALKIEDRTMWGCLWIIPLFSTLFGMLYCTVSDVYAYASWQFLVSRYLMLFGACYVSYVALKVLEISRSRTRLEEEVKYADRNLLAQRKQYERLAIHMEETRKARHDLRQHLNLIQNYLDNGDEAALQSYITAYGKSLPRDTEKTYCKNYATDVVIRYYAEEARKSGIDFVFQTNLPATLPMDEPEFCALLGNLLENAVDACREFGGDISTYIRLHILLDDKLLSITVDNTCLTKPQEQDGRLLSTKREGYGIGTQSVRSIAEKYHGSAEFECADGEFLASVFLQLLG